MNREEAVMRIGFVEPHLQLYGGIRRIIELANRLTDRGHDVTVYHPAGTPCDWLECRAAIRPTAEAMDRQHDVLIYNDPNPQDHATVRRAPARLRVFYVLALYEKHLLHGFHPTLWLPSRRRMSVMRSALRTADLVLANSTWMHRWLRDVLGIRSRLVIGGINHDHFHPAGGQSDDAGPFRILYSGDPRVRKGTDTVRAALELVRSEEPGIQPDTYHGRGVEQTGMARLYSSADVFVDAQRYAGWNNPVVEAMACGVPTVCTAIGGVEDFAFHEQTALLVPPGDPEALTRALVRAIRDPALRGRLRENALEHVRAFTWERSAERLEEVLAEALGETPAPPVEAVRHSVGATLQSLRQRVLQRGRHFDKYDLRGAYHWSAYETDPVYRHHVDHVVHTLQPPGTLLDVGCGDGLIAAHLADAGFEVTGIDVEPTAIRLARQQRPEIRFERRDLFQIDGMYDVVVASEVIEHLDAPHTFLEKIGSLFRERALITTPERDYYSDLDPYHRTEYAYHEYVSLLSKHFRDVRVEASGGHLYGWVADPRKGGG